MIPELREVVGHPKYMVSNEGAVYSKHFKALKRLKVRIDKGGYLYTQIWVNRHNKQLYIHRAVGATFHPNPDGYREVRHLDDNKLNNCADNLAWGTSQDNADDKRRNGGVRWGDSSGVAVITVAQGVEIVRRAAQGESYLAIAKAFGRTPAYISALITGKRRPYLRQMALEAA